MSLVVQAWPAIEDALRTTRPLPTKATNLAYENPGCSRKCSTTDRCGTHANGRAAEKAAVQDFLEALFRTRTGDPLLTMRSKRQPVAVGGNGLALLQAIFGFWRPEPLPPVAPPLFHNCSISIGPKRQFDAGQSPGGAARLQRRMISSQSASRLHGRGGATRGRGKFCRSGVGQCPVQVVVPTRAAVTQV